MRRACGLDGCSESCVIRSRRHFRRARYGLPQAYTSSTITMTHLGIDTRRPIDALSCTTTFDNALAAQSPQPYTISLHPTKAMLTALWSSICATPATLCPHTPIKLATLCHGYDTRSLSLVLFSLFCFHLGHEDVALCCSWGRSCRCDGMSF
jgi:hypothetical protein